MESAVLVIVLRVVSRATGSAVERSKELSIALLTMTVEAALVAAMAMALAIVVLHRALARWTARLSADVLREARSRVMHAFENASWSRQEADRQGALQEMVSTMAQKSANLATMVVTAMASLLGMAALIATALLVDFAAAAAVIGLGVLVGLAIRPTARAVVRRANVFARDSALFAEEVSQWGSMAMTLKVFGRGSAEVARLETLNARSADHNFRLRIVGRTMAFIVKDLAILMLVIAVALAYSWSAAGVTRLGGVIVLMIRAIAYAQQAQEALHGIVEDGPNFTLLNERIASLAECRDLIKSKAHLDIAAKATQKSITKVKDVKKLLPISAAKHRRVVVVGRGAPALFPGAPRKEMSAFMDELKQRGFEARSYDPKNPPTKENADLLLYVMAVESSLGLSHIHIDWLAEHQGLDTGMTRYWHDLPTLIVAFGHPYFLRDAPRMPALVNAYSTNEAAQRAAAKAITGEAKFEGTSPVDAFAGAPDARY